MKTTYNAKTIQAKTIAMACLVCLVGLALALTLASLPIASQQAHADTYVVTTAASASSKNTVITLTAKEQKAYKRALAACMDYAHQPNPIVVDMSDLGLTSKQAINVGYLLHANGELFWINTYDDNSFGRKKFTLPCYYSDSVITSMRKKLNAAVSKALKRVGPGMTKAAKVHMLHDYLCERITYTTGCKDAYTGLVKGKGDCFSYSLAMDLLLRRCGFSTDMAFNDRLDHVWNVVKIGSTWYHVDVGWDAGYRGRKLNGYFDWRGKNCHLYLLQSDNSMNHKVVDPTTGQYLPSHQGWTCYHACSSRSYDATSIRNAKGTFNKSCKAYKSIVRSFSKAGLKFKVTASKKVIVSGVSGKKQKAASALAIPATVTYKATTYSVSGIGASAFSNAKAKTLRISTAKLTAANVKGSLTNSKVKKVILQGKAAKKAAAYKKYFKKSNAGKTVKVVVAA